VAGLKTRLAELQAQVGSIKEKQGTHKAKFDIYQEKLSLVKAQEFMFTKANEELKKFQYAHDNAEVEMTKPCHACGKPHDPSEIEDFKMHQRAAIEKAHANAGVIAGQVDGMKIVAEKARLEEVAAQLEVAKLNPQTIFDETNAINAELAEIARLDNEIATKKASMQTYVDKMKSVMTEANPELRVVEHITEAIKLNQEELEAAEGAIAELEKEAEVANAVVKVFSPAGVRAHILDTVTPFLNDRTSDYLSALSDGNIHAIWTTITTTTKGDLREKFNIEVSNDKGGKSFKSLSGGEKRKVRLATMLALQDLVASRATKPIGLWIGDEIDHALDEAGLERLMGILDRKARERGTVLVISHNSLSDWVDNVVTVTKRDGVSTIEGSLCQ
jgi:DNA repair exonuclease SbcCD ATPase subunit